MQLFHLIFISIVAAGVVLCSEFHYDENGEDWADNEWECLSGESQSPINIETELIPINENSHLILKKAAEGTGEIPIVNNGHSIQADYPWLEFEATNVQGQKKHFQAEQLHFHSPSEHSFNGELADFEIHIVCNQVDGPDNGLSKGVFTFVFKEGDVENPMIETFSQAAAAFSSSAESVFVCTNLYDNLNTVLANFEKLNYYTYQGSLTTPPCTEIVEWFIIKQVLPISANQLKNFQALWGDNQEFAEGKGNNRKVQALNGRTIIQGCVSNQLQAFAATTIPHFCFTLILIILMIWL